MESRQEKSQPTPAIVIMAAGKGTRLKSKRSKVLHEIGGKPLLLHVIASASKVAAPHDIVVVIGHQADSVRAAVEHTGVRFVEQTVQRGTGHAVQSAAESIAGLLTSAIAQRGGVPEVAQFTDNGFAGLHGLHNDTEPRPETFEFSRIRTRAEAYQLLAEAADFLARTEPHSPTPYLVRRAVSWGSMPFDKLLTELVSNSGELIEIARLLNLNNLPASGK